MPHFTCLIPDERQLPPSNQKLNKISPQPPHFTLNKKSSQALHIFPVYYHTPPYQCPKISGSDITIYQYAFEPCVVIRQHVDGMTSSGTKFISVLVKIGVLYRSHAWQACPPPFLEEERMKVMTTGPKRRLCQTHTTFYMALPTDVSHVLNSIARMLRMSGSVTLPPTPLWDWQGKTLLKPTSFCTRPIVHPCVDIRINVRYWWKGDWQCKQKILSKCHSSHHKCHKDCRRTEPGPLWLYAGDQLNCAYLQYQSAKGMCGRLCVTWVLWQREVSCAKYGSVKWDDTARLPVHHVRRHNQGSMIMWGR